MAYGTESIAPVDKIFGPGSGAVNAAKLLVSRDVAIDSVSYTHLTLPTIYSV